MPRAFPIWHTSAQHERQGGRETQLTSQTCPAANRTRTPGGPEARASRTVHTSRQTADPLFGPLTADGAAPRRSNPAPPPAGSPLTLQWPPRTAPHSRHRDPVARDAWSRLRTPCTAYRTHTRTRTRGLIPLRCDATDMPRAAQDGAGMCTCGKVYLSLFPFLPSV
jgi:hypothetical protein